MKIPGKRFVHNYKKLLIAAVFIMALPVSTACRRMSAISGNTLDSRSIEQSSDQSLNQVQVTSAARTVQVLLYAGAVLDGEKINTGDIDRYFTAIDINEGDPIYRRIIGKSYRQNDNIALGDLRYLKLLHYNYKHEIQVGELIVHKDIAETVSDIFKELYAVEYEIESMYLVDNYWPEIKTDGGIYNEGVEADAESMRRNNTSCFNYRVVPDSTSLSKHALGYAIDINPLPNPYVVYDRAGNPVVQGGGDASYIDRSNKREHMIDYGDPAYRIFSEHGFKWGGDWNSSKDYQHFLWDNPRK